MISWPRINPAQHHSFRQVHLQQPLYAQLFFIVYLQIKRGQTYDFFLWVVYLFLSLFLRENQLDKLMRYFLLFTTLNLSIRIKFTTLIFASANNLTISVFNTLSCATYHFTVLILSTTTLWIGGTNYSAVTIS